jgi:hypothetical protein
MVYPGVEPHLSARILQPEKYRYIGGMLRLGNKKRAYFLLANYARVCYSNYRILEVFAVYKATKTFDFVAFFC